MKKEQKGPGVEVAGTGAKILIAPVNVADGLNRRVENLGNGNYQIILIDAETGKETPGRIFKGKPTQALL